MTEVAKFTPGPWSIGRSADNTPLIMVPVPASEGSGFGVACVNRLPRMGSVQGDMVANARLIAAAPDLLAAAIWAEAALAPFSHEPSEKSGISLLRAAIAKATT